LFIKEKDKLVKFFIVIYFFSIYLLSKLNSLKTQIIMNLTSPTFINNFKSTTSSFVKSVLGWLLLIIIIVSGCKKDNRSVELIKKGNLIVNEDQSSLNGRVKRTNEIMPVSKLYQSVLKSEGTPPKVDLTKNYVFKLVAEVDPPEYEGNTLQATHVRIVDHYAFVTYNTKGDKYLGGLDVFDVTNIRDPKLIWNAIFKDVDISSVDYYNNKIYLVGAWNLDADKTVNLKTPAMLEVLNLHSDRTIDTVESIIDLSSFAGTDVRVTDNAIYTTSGSNGYVKIFDHAYRTIDSMSLDNARAIDYNSNKIFVLQGQSGRISIFNKGNNKFEQSFSIGGADQAEAKSELAVSDEYVFAALNEGGVQMRNLDASLTLKHTLPRPETPAGESDDNYVSNSVSLHGDLVLIANGEAGLYVGGMVDTKNDSIAMIGKIQFSGNPSANFVDAKDSIIFVATGLGGLKILTLGIDEGLPPIIIPTKPCPTLYTDIMKYFPESQNNCIKYDKQFFSNDTISKQLVLTKESEVYVTYIGEGAGWKNTLGYYTYNKNNPPAKVEDLTKTILFPNISGVGEGGGLNPGDMVQVGKGKFPAGTVISFYLVCIGWANGQTVPGYYTQYSDPWFNIKNHQQHLLFLEETCSDIVMTFEDIDQEDYLYYWDNDFNDVVFSISDNKDPDKMSVSFDLTKIPKIKVQ
jgi:hypothetical protein